MEQILLHLVVDFPVLFMVFVIIMVEFGDPEMRKSAQDYCDRNRENRRGRRKALAE